jgi:lysophospholipase L1-like esterase
MKNTVMSIHIKYNDFSPTRSLRRIHTICALIICALFLPLPGAAHSQSNWVGTWGAPPDSVGAAFDKQFVRQIVKTSVGGSALRIKLSNFYGTQSVFFGKVSLSEYTKSSNKQAPKENVILFKGKSSVSVPIGESVMSDAIDIDVKPLQEYAITMNFPMNTGPSTIHGTGMQNAFISKPGTPITTGEAGTAYAASDFTIDDSRFFITDIEVLNTEHARTLVIIGDSISDGVGSSLDGNMRWPDQLSARLQEDKNSNNIAVVNSGIGGNRLLNDAVAPFVGPSALSRFDRDVLSKSGLKWIILSQGINDIMGASILSSPKDKVSAELIIAGMQILIARAHENKVKIFGTTLLPRGGSTGDWKHTPDDEVKRAAVNAWIRQTNEFDAVIDFDKILRDPARQDRLLPTYDSGDFTHPNDAGYRAMAQAIDVRLFDSHRD